MAWHLTDEKPINWTNVDQGLDVVWHHKATELTYSIISSCYIPWERRVLNPCTWSAWGRMGVQQGQRNASSAAHRWPEENRKQLIRSMIAENRACLFWKSSLARLQEFTSRNSSICLYEIKRNKANLRDLIAATGLVILLELDSNRRFFSRETPNLGQNRRFFLAEWPWNLTDDLQKQ